MPIATTSTLTQCHVPFLALKGTAVTSWMFLSPAVFLCIYIYAHLGGYSDVCAKVIFNI